MAEATLVLHKGARRVDEDELEQIQPPPSTPTWYPTKHSDVLRTACRQIEDAGYQIMRIDRAVSQDGHRMFATMNLGTQLVQGVALAVGIRNSTDQTFPMGFCCGSRVFTCDNLAFSADLIVRRKHTKNGLTRYVHAISEAATRLCSYQEVERDRIVRMQALPLAEERAESLILRAHLDGIISYRHLPEVVKEWREPSHDHGEPTLWRLQQAFTAGLSKLVTTNPNDFAYRTIRLNGLLGTALPYSPPLEVEEPESHPLAV